VELKLKINTDYSLKEIVSNDPLVIERLRDLGIFEGASIKIINIISFNSVYVLQLNDSLVALNKAEMSCLRF
jgi:Fe2+ transport system protein FeoA